MAEQIQHTLYQVSTTALVEGIYQGAMQVAALREYGDLGYVALDTDGGRSRIKIRERR